MTSSCNISQYSSLLRFPSMRTMWPTPCAVIIPHSVTLPPPCFTFFFVNRGSNCSPGFLQHHSTPSDPKTWNIDSSEKLTALQFETVYSRWSSAHVFHTCRFLFEMNGTEQRIWASRPSALSVRLIVCTETSGKYTRCRSVASWAVVFDRCRRAMRVSRGVSLWGWPVRGITS